MPVFSILFWVSLSVQLVLAAERRLSFAPVRTACLSGRAIRPVSGTPDGDRFGAASTHSWP